MDWKNIAQAHGMMLSANELDRITSPLTALEQTFRPLAISLTPDMEPDPELHLEEEQ
jgi:hypothetical protein